jgi:DNA-binding CsgD family transcriptional regulator
VEALTPREREILRLLAAGKTAKPIAAELSLSVPTVRTHIQHILRKLGVHSCLEAAVVFLRSSHAAVTGLSGAMLSLLDLA